MHYAVEQKSEQQQNAPFSSRLDVSKLHG